MQRLGQVAGQEYGRDRAQKSRNPEGAQAINGLDPLWAPQMILRAQGPKDQLTPEPGVRIDHRRKPDLAWMRSYYKQIIINPRVRIPGVPCYGTDIILAAFRARHRARALTDYPQRQTDIAAAYGVDTTTALWLEHVAQKWDPVLSFSNMQNQ